MEYAQLERTAVVGLGEERPVAARLNPEATVAKREGVQNLAIAPGRRASVKPFDNRTQQVAL